MDVGVGKGGGRLGVSASVGAPGSHPAAAAWRPWASRPVCREKGAADRNRRGAVAPRPYRARCGPGLGRSFGESERLVAESVKADSGTRRRDTFGERRNCSGRWVRGLGGSRGVCLVGLSAAIAEPAGVLTGATVRSGALQEAVVECPRPGSRDGARCWRARGFRVDGRGGR
jgi:hypothetical protein